MLERYENWRELKPLGYDDAIRNRVVILHDAPPFYYAGEVFNFVGFTDGRGIVVSPDDSTASKLTMAMDCFANLPTESTEYSEWRKREVWDCAKRMWSFPESPSPKGCLDAAETLMAEWDRRYK